MKLEILRDNLNFGLSVVSRVLVSKPQLPILTHILLTASDGQLNLTASNLETTITISVGAKVEIGGEFTVPGRTLVEIISNLTAEKISLEVKEKILQVSTKNSHLKINGASASEYPKVMGDEIGNNEELSWEIEAKDFVPGVSSVVFCAATDESRPVLTGVLIKLSKSEIVLAATDGFRLSVSKIPVVTSSKASESESFIVPAKTLGEISRVVEKGQKIKLSLLKESNQIVFQTGDIKFLSRLISGKFPDFEKIIPSNSTFSLSVSSAELSKAIKLAAIFARESSNIVKLKIVNEKLRISANAPEVGENETEVSVSTQGVVLDEFVIAFNFHYLSDLLTTLDSTDITINLNGPLASGVFKMASDPDFLHLIMPVQVQD